MIRGFACGVFDLYHPGHVLMLEACKTHCDHLTLAVNRGESFDENINPGKRRPYFTADERHMILQSIRYVDDILFYNNEEELTQIMQTGNFQVRFLGDDYQNKAITAREAIEQIVFLDRSHGYSTTDIVNRILERNTQKPA